MALSITHLYKSFGDNHVLIDFNLQLNRGENVAVLGKSGSGKSVLIKCIIGLLKPDKGSINILGRDIEDLSLRELDEVRTRVGFLFQSNALYDSMTVRENLEFPLRRHWIKLTTAERNEKVTEVLKNVGLVHTIDMLPAELSGGMRKRIALARTLILEPEIILYDEPTTGLDPITGKEISNLIMELGEKYNTSAIIISHDINCIHRTADRIVMLIDGKCYADGTYDALKNNNDIKVKQFFE
ncbi:MAG: ATP-binding cassette domain-containing protein [Chitinophagaceae bacterium]|nr:ATP-binding cassette domain-containing protein [Chitinophagaceae bacterium]MBL0130086.1 ATP-binding cassette domain-containing protein [Chitinophagaceae bacterium]MBL0273590.1 ATP-binding cassette domain-containing protein [Chitinophagaceae bacterium]